VRVTGPNVAIEALPVTATTASSRAAARPIHPVVAHRSEPDRDRGDDEQQDAQRDPDQFGLALLFLPADHEQSDCQHGGDDARGSDDAEFADLPEAGQSSVLPGQQQRHEKPDRENEREKLTRRGADSQRFA
jgi:hypothetical protein